MFSYFERSQGVDTLCVLPRRKTPIEGKTSVRLTYDADSFLSRLWLKDGKPLVSGDRFSFFDGNRVLSISPVDRTDTGTVLCNVSNDFSFDTAKCQLQVYCKNFNLALLCHYMFLNMYKVKE